MVLQKQGATPIIHRFNFGADCVEVIFNFCPGWAEVEFWSSNQLGRKPFLFPTSCREVSFENSVQLGQNYFFEFFRKTLLKLPFSAATTGRDFSKITPQNANHIGYHLEKHFENCSRNTHKKFGFPGYHLRTTMDKMPFSLAMFMRRTSPADTECRM